VARLFERGELVQLRAGACVGCRLVRDPQNLFEGRRYDGVGRARLQFPGLGFRV
jgi:hypothetical protein